MSQKASLSAIGLFVIVGLALVVIAAFYFGGAKVFREKDSNVSFFPGSVTGIRIGSAAEFRGSMVGEVTDIKILYDPKERRYDVAVFYTVWNDRITTIEEFKTVTVEELSYDELINVLGLRARMDLKSFVTVQQVISLEFLPDTPKGGSNSKHKGRSCWPFAGLGAVRYTIGYSCESTCYDPKSADI